MDAHHLSAMDGGNVTVPWNVTSSSLNKIAAVAVSSGSIGLALCFWALMLETFRWRNSKLTRKKSSPILWWKILVDVINTINALWISVQFMLEVTYDIGDRDDEETACRVYTAVQLVTSRASSVWFLIWSIDVFLSMRNPFCTVAGNMWRYHVAVWTFAIAITVASMAGNALSEGLYTYCWLRRARQQDLWALFFSQFPLPHLLALSFAMFVAFRLYRAMGRINPHATAGLCARKSLLAKSLSLVGIFGLAAIYKLVVCIVTVTHPPKTVDFDTVAMYTYTESVYLALHGLANLVAILVLRSWSRRLVLSARNEAERLPVSQAVGTFEEMGRGRGDNVDEHGNVIPSHVRSGTAASLASTASWIQIKKLNRDRKWRRSTQSTSSLFAADPPAEPMSQAYFQRSATDSANHRDDDDDDVDPDDFDAILLRALRDDIMLCTLFGIISTLNRRTRSTNPILKQTVMLPPIFNREIEFIDYHQKTFANLRTAYGIKPKDYAASIWGKEMRKEIKKMTEQFSSGGSGSFFYLTHDKRFLIKTITEKERDILMKLLPAYTTYVTLNPSTLLVRFCGLHAVRLTREQRFITFVVLQHVMNDASYRPRIDRIYDLKGSTQNRGTTVRSPSWLSRFLYRLGFASKPAASSTPPLLQASRLKAAQSSSATPATAAVNKQPHSRSKAAVGKKKGTAKSGTRNPIRTALRGKRNQRARAADQKSLLINRKDSDYLVENTSDSDDGSDTDDDSIQGGTEDGAVVEEEAGKKGTAPRCDAENEDELEHDGVHGDDDDVWLKSGEKATGPVIKVGDHVIDMGASTITTADGDVIGVNDAEALSGLVEPLFMKNYKDQDLIAHGKVKIGEKAKCSLSTRLTCDVAFLHGEQIMDFSLLVGIHFCDDYCSASSSRQISRLPPQLQQHHQPFIHRAHRGPSAQRAMHMYHDGPMAFSGQQKTAGRRSESPTPREGQHDGFYSSVSGYQRPRSDFNANDSSMSSESTAHHHTSYTHQNAATEIITRTRADVESTATGHFGSSPAHSQSQSQSPSLSPKRALPTRGRISDAFSEPGRLIADRVHAVTPTANGDGMSVTSSPYFHGDGVEIHTSRSTLQQQQQQQQQQRLRLLQQHRHHSANPCHCSKGRQRRDGVVRDRFGRVDLRQGVQGTFNGRSCVVYFGVIDILQKYDSKKRLESWLKTTFCCLDDAEISSVNPDIYCQRFHRRVLQYIE